VAALASRERVVLFSMVGDAMALPLLEALDEGNYDLAVSFLSNSAAPLSTDAKRRLTEHLPGLQIADGLGSSEAGHLGRRAGEATFFLTEGAVALSEDLSRELKPGEDEVGWLCTSGRHARGYLGHKEKTEATFVDHDGRSLVVSGDRVRLRADGSVELLGRDSMVINSGGEKIFAEEVEDRLRHIDGIVDAVVLGRPHPRWGNEVVAVVQLAPGVDLPDDALRTAAAEQLARYKLPRAIVRTDAVRRGPNGKVDYGWARGLVESTP
jgi:3-oxocholest-4-en-26-oate---CoA ligase